MILNTKWVRLANSFMITIALWILVKEISISSYNWAYTSNSIWFFLLPKKPIIITNMDGLEWKRTKYSKPVQQFLKFAERLAAMSSDYLVSDSLGIKKFLLERYKKASTYIAYGAHPFSNPDESILSHYEVEKGNYNMIMARFEPENNLDMVLEGVSLCEEKTPILVVGNHNTKYGEYLKNKFKYFPQHSFFRRYL